MILVDANVWIDHLHCPDPALSRLLEASHVLMHPLVLGELACGTFKDRAERLRAWRELPRAEVAEHDRVIDWIEAQSLAGAGIGFIDAHLLHAAVTRRDARLWTGDRRLRGLAARFGKQFLQDDT